ncbi:MAG: hypothetical protein ACK53L_17685, partial [Pirellulaceae bacterium]
GKFGLVIEQLELAGCACLEQVDDPFRLCREMRRGPVSNFCCRGGGCLAPEQRIQGEPGEADAAVAEEPAAGEKSEFRRG